MIDREKILADIYSTEKPDLIEEYTEKWKGAGRRELRARLKSLNKDRNSHDTKAEIDAINALLV